MRRRGPAPAAGGGASSRRRTGAQARRGAGFAGGPGGRGGRPGSSAARRLRARVPAPARPRRAPRGSAARGAWSRARGVAGPGRRPGPPRAPVARLAQRLRGAFPPPTGDPTLGTRGPGPSRRLELPFPRSRTTLRGWLQLESEPLAALCPGPSGPAPRSGDGERGPATALRRGPRSGLRAGPSVETVCSAEAKKLLFTF